MRLDADRCERIGLFLLGIALGLLIAVLFYTC